MNPSASPVPYLDLSAQNKPLLEEINQALSSAIEKNQFCLGPDVDAFEEEFASFCDVPYCVAVNSGTSALHLSLLLANVGPGDEVITTPYTFAATSWAISYVGATPVYVDIDTDDFNLNPALIEEKVTSKTKAILPVHLYGHPCDLDAIQEIANRHDLAIIEDAAQAHGALYKKKRIGQHGLATCFSFYPAKNLGTFGEGGALVLKDETLYQRAKALRNHGSSQRYHYDEVGYNYRMEGLQAAVLRIKLKHLDKWNQRRREIAHLYHELLKDTPLTLPYETPNIQSVYHLYVIRHNKRDQLMEWLTQHQIGCAIHYPIPLHLQKCYRFLGHKKGDFPTSENISDHCLCLPIYPEMTNEQVMQVANTVRLFFDNRS